MVLFGRPSGKIEQIHPLDDEKSVDIVLPEFMLNVERARLDFGSRHFELIGKVHNHFSIWVKLLG